MQLVPLEKETLVYSRHKRPSRHGKKSTVHFVLGHAGGNPAVRNGIVLLE